MAGSALWSSRGHHLRRNVFATQRSRSACRVGVWGEAWRLQPKQEEGLCCLGPPHGRSRFLQVDQPPFGPRPSRVNARSRRRAAAATGSAKPQAGALEAGALGAGGDIRHAEAWRCPGGDRADRRPTLPVEPHVMRLGEAVGFRQMRRTGGACRTPCILRNRARPRRSSLKVPPRTSATDDQQTRLTIGPVKGHRQSVTCERYVSSSRGLNFNFERVCLEQRSA